MWTGTTVCNNFAIKTIEQLLFSHGVKDVKWPLNDQQMSQVLQCYVHGTDMISSSSFDVFLVKYLIHEVLSFYEMLHNDKLQDKSILRWMYAHYCRVLETVQSSDICSKEGLANLEEFRTAMLAEVQTIQKIV